MIFNFAVDNVLSAIAALISEHGTVRIIVPCSELTAVPDLEVCWAFSSSKSINKIENA